MVPRTKGYAYGVGVWDSSIVQGPVSVAPCLPLTYVTIRNFGRWQLRRVPTAAQAADQALHADVRAALSPTSCVPATLVLLSKDLGFVSLLAAARRQGVRFLGWWAHTGGGNALAFKPPTWTK